MNFEKFLHHSLSWFFILKMSLDSVLEQQRRYHEERERLMDTMTKEMLRKKATVRVFFDRFHQFAFSVFLAS